MAAYTIEDIELIRRKSGISYQEAVSLLDYHNGNVARALVDLERNGRIKPDAETRRAAAQSSTPYSASGNVSSSAKSGKNGFVDLVSAFYRARIKVNKDDTPIINLSALFGIISVIVAPHIVIFGAIASLVLGYKFSFSKSDKAFEGENLERMVRSAADNVKSSVGDFARGFQNGVNGEAQSAPQSAAQPAADDRSYYTARPAATASAAYSSTCPTLNVPVQVESQDGSVTVEGDAEGYSSATIE